MSQAVPIQVGAHRLLAQVSGAGEAVPATSDEALSFDGVRDTIEAICGELAHAFEAAKPVSATVQFGLKLAAQSGKLTGLLVEGTGEATLTLWLTWGAPIPPPSSS